MVSHTSTAASFTALPWFFTTTSGAVTVGTYAVTYDAVTVAWRAVCATVAVWGTFTAYAAAFRSAVVIVTVASGFTFAAFSTIVITIVITAVDSYVFSAVAFAVAFATVACAWAAAA